MLLLFSPPLSPGFAGAFLEMGGLRRTCVGGCPTLRGEAREKFPVSSVIPTQLSLKMKRKKAQRKAFLPEPAALPCSQEPLLTATAMLIHLLGCPDLEIGVNLPTTPREAMPSIGEATLILVLCFSCQGGVKGQPVNEDSQLTGTEPGRAPRWLCRCPGGTSCCVFSGGWDG